MIGISSASNASNQSSLDSSSTLNFSGMGSITVNKTTAANNVPLYLAVGSGIVFFAILLG